LILNVPDTFSLGILAVLIWDAEYLKLRAICSLLEDKYYKYNKVFIRKLVA